MRQLNTFILKNFIEKKCVCSFREINLKSKLQMANLKQRHRILRIVLIIFFIMINRYGMNLVLTYLVGQLFWYFRIPNKVYFCHHNVGGSVFEKKFKKEKILKKNKTTIYICIRISRVCFLICSFIEISTRDAFSAKK